VTSPQRRKGNAAEREAAHQLADLTGWNVRRRLQEGRADDTGDLEGVPDCCVQVKAYADQQRAIREGLLDLRAQQERSGCTFGVLLVRRPGGRYLACMELDQLATLLREATAPTDYQPVRN
jgi:ribosomal protein L19E